MKGSAVAKMARLGAHLLAKPKLVPMWIRYSPITGGRPVDAEIPWTAFDAIQFLDQFVTSSMDVLEWGGGGSTLFFARRARSVTTIESDRDWVAELKSKADMAGLANVDVVYAALELTKDKFVNSSFLNVPLDRLFDVVLIDGYEEDEQLRPECLKRARTLVKPGGIVVVDDSWRYSDVALSAGQRDWQRFTSVGPFRYGVTSTDIYFY